MGDPLSVLERVLAVDDDPVCLRTTELALRHGGFEVWSATSGAAALQRIESRGLPHLAVVDIRMPGLSGIEFAERVHSFSDLPIILLTAVDDPETMVDTLEQFADDYITKPIDPALLVARVRRVLRRVGDFSYALAPTITVDEHLSLDLARQRALVSGNEIGLTPTENKILCLLMRNGGRVVRSEYLLRGLSPFDELDERALRTHIYRLRRKIEPDLHAPRYVMTVRGTGYRFPPPATR